MLLIMLYVLNLDAVHAFLDQDLGQDSLVVRLHGHHSLVCLNSRTIINKDSKFTYLYKTKHNMYM